MLRFGIVTDIDAAKGLARVYFREDDIVSDWLPTAYQKVHADSFSWAYDINEHVACLMDEHAENGVIIGAIYDSGNQPNGGNKDKYRAVFSDGTILEYDRAAHKLYAEVKGEVHVKADGDINAECANANVIAQQNITADCQQASIMAAVQITADTPLMVVTGLLQAGSIQAGGVGGGTGDVTISGNVQVEGDVAADGDVQAGTISLTGHVHGGVQTGGGVTGGPQ